MTEKYEDFYKVFGCRINRPCTADKDCKSPCAADKECKNPCANTVMDFCYEPAECNDCIIEHVGYAQAYVPYQEDITLLSPEEAVACGTVFPMLVQPYRRKRYPEERCC